MKFSRTGQFLGCSKYPECKATRPIGRPAPRRGRRDRARLPQVRQAADDPREQAGRDVPVVLGIPRLQGVVQHRRGGQPRPLGRRDRVRLREVRQADGHAARARGAVPGLHGLSQVPQHHARRRRRASRVRRSRSRSSARSAAAPMGVKQGRRGAFLGCLNYPKCRGTAPDPRRPQGAARRAGRRRPGGDRGRPQDDRRSRRLRELRRPDARPPQPPRLLPRLRQVSQVQGDPRSPSEETLAKINAAVGT